MGQGVVSVVGDHHALACGEAVILDDVGCAEGVQCRGCLVRVGGHQRHGGGDAGFGHDLLRESLGSLELGGVLAGPEHRDAGVAHGVGHAGREGSLGANHHKVDVEPGGERRHRVRIVPVDGVRGDELADAGVARSRVDFGNVGVGKEGADNGVFAAAGANDEYLHSLQAYFVHRAGS